MSEWEVGQMNYWGCTVLPNYSLLWANADLSSSLGLKGLSYFPSPKLHIWSQIVQTCLLWDWRGCEDLVLSNVTAWRPPASIQLGQWPCDLICNHCSLKDAPLWSFAEYNSYHRELSHRHHGLGHGYEETIECLVLGTHMHSCVCVSRHVCVCMYSCRHVNACVWRHVHAWTPESTCACVCVCVCW